MKIRTLLLLTALLLLVAACGKRGPVRPLEAPIPQPATALELRQRGEAMLLAWQLPTANLDGSALAQPPQLDIYRMNYIPAEECPECFDRSSLLASIDPELPAPARKSGARFFYLDRQVQPGVGYQYKLIAHTAAELTGRPVILRQAMEPAMPAPQQFQATPQDRSVQLRWQPVKPDDQHILLGYNVYRQRDGAPPSLAPLNRAPLQANNFEDFGLENGSLYLYRVRALFARNDAHIESLATPELKVIPQAGN